jgi:hypothetical protein
MPELNKRNHAVYLQEIAEDAIPSQTNLWPSIRSQVAPSKPTTPMYWPRSRQQRFALVGLVVLLLALVVPPMAPTAVSAATNVLERIGLIEPAPVPAPAVCTNGTTHAAPVGQDIERAAVPAGDEQSAITVPDGKCPDGFDFQPAMELPAKP